MKAFVTGSTGLLGSNLVNLLLAQGHEVKALARSEAKARKLLVDPRVQIVVGDMEDVDGFADALDGSDVVFHTAAYFREYYGAGEDHWQKLEQINVQGTIKLLTEAERRGVKKAIYVSSSGVIGRRADGTPSDESDGPDDSARENLYFRSKVVAEEAVADFLKTHSLPVVLILPTAILGPQDAAPTTLGQGIVDILERKYPVVPPGGFAVVDARDVAQGMINAVERGRSGERYILNNRFLTLAEMVEIIGRVSGVQTPSFRMPYPGMLAIAALSEFGSRFTGQEPQITINTVKVMRHAIKINAAKAQRVLGVKFRPVEDTLRDEVRWFIDNGYVKQQSVVSYQPSVISGQ